MGMYARYEAYATVACRQLTHKVKFLVSGGISIPAPGPIHW